MAEYEKWIDDKGAEVQRRFELTIFKDRRKAANDLDWALDWLQLVQDGSDSNENVIESVSGTAKSKEDARADGEFAAQTLVDDSTLVKQIISIEPISLSLPQSRMGIPTGEINGPIRT